MLQDFVSIDAVGKFQVLYAGGGDECLQAIQVQVDPAHLTLLDPRQEVNEITATEKGDCV